MWYSFYPLPDWIRELPEKEFIEWGQNSLLYDCRTKQDALRLQEKNKFYFIEGFTLFEELARRRVHDSPYPDYDSPVKYHARDTFDHEGRVYGYSRDRVKFRFILISSGPDGKRDMDERVFDVRKPNYGFNRPLADLTYDPTNGLQSSGDMFYIKP